MLLEFMLPRRRVYVFDCQSLPDRFSPNSFATFLRFSKVILPVSNKANKTGRTKEIDHNT